MGAGPAAVRDLTEPEVLYSARSEKDREAVRGRREQFVRCFPGPATGRDEITLRGPSGVVREPSGPTSETVHGPQPVRVRSAERIGP